jgi:hypothetical protein
MMINHELQKSDLGYTVMLLQLNRLYSAKWAGKMIMNSVKMKVGGVIIYFKVLALHSYGRTEEN